MTGFCITKTAKTTSCKGGKCLPIRASAPPRAASSNRALLRFYPPDLAASAAAKDKLHPGSALLTRKVRLANCYLEIPAILSSCFLQNQVSSGPVSTAAQKNSFPQKMQRGSNSSRHAVTIESQLSFAGRSFGNRLTAAAHRQLKLLEQLHCEKVRIQRLHPQGGVAHALFAVVIIQFRPDRDFEEILQKAKAQRHIFLYGF